MAGRDAARAPRRPRLHLQVEHGLDARHARVHEQRSDPPQVASQQAHVLADVRLQRELRAAVLARRSGARQAARCSTRCPATSGRSTRPCARCTATCARIPARSCCSWAARSGSGASGITTASSTGRARRSGARRPAALGARSQPLSTPASPRSGRTTTSRAASSGSIARTSSTASSRSCGAATTTRGHGGRGRQLHAGAAARRTASACRAPARISSC